MLKLSRGEIKHRVVTDTPGNVTGLVKRALGNCLRSVAIHLGDFEGSIFSIAVPLHDVSGCAMAAINLFDTIVSANGAGFEKQPTARFCMPRRKF